MRTRHSLWIPINIASICRLSIQLQEQSKSNQNSMDKPRFQVNAQLPNGLPNKFTILSSLSYEALKTHLKKLSDLSEISVTYKDEEGDDITLTNEEDFTEAKRALDFRSILSLQLTVKAVPNATPYREPVREIEAPKPQPTPRFSASSKVKKIGYYPQLAEDLGETLHISEPTKSVAMTRNTQTTPDLTNVSSVHIQLVDIIKYVYNYYPNFSTISP